MLGKNCTLFHLKANRGVVIRTIVIILSVLVSLLSCVDSLPDQKFLFTDNQTVQDISKVIIAEICADTNLHLAKPILFSDTLTRFHLALNPDSISQKDMLNCLIHDKRLMDTIPFLKIDSLFLVAQEQQTDVMKLTTSGCTRLKPAKVLREMQDSLMRMCEYSWNGYFALTIPVFSLDKKTAVVSLEFHGFSIDSYYRQVYLLRQTGQTWTILKVKTIAMA